MSCATATKDCKCKNEHDDLDSSPDGGGDNHGPLGELHWAKSPQVALGEETPQEVRQEGRVDADGQPSHPGADDVGVDAVQAELGPVLVREPEREGHEETDDQTDGDHYVGSTSTEKLVAYTTPGDCLGVVRLHVLARPDVGSLDAEENLALVTDNGVHHDPVEDCSDAGANHLSSKASPWWKFCVLSELEILEHK